MKDGNTLLTLQSKLRHAIQFGKLNIVLASASPRRVEALQVMLGGADLFTVNPSDFAEDHPHHHYADATEYSMATARSKAQDVCAKLKTSINVNKVLVIAADTIVTIDHQILEKPASSDDAARMLRMLSGKQHKVHTSVVVYELPAMQESIAFTSTSQVRFAKLSDAEISAYIETGEAQDKAGAYGVQGYGRMLIESIEGDFFNVMGFPAREFAVKFADIVINLIDF